MDFQSIQRIGDSLKKTDDQKSKIGRFGIGFNSVYHLTDLPSFISSNFLVMLDPQVRIKRRRKRRRKSLFKITSLIISILIIYNLLGKIFT